MKAKFLIAGALILASSSTFANKLSADLNFDTFHIKADATHASNNVIYSGELFLTDDQGKVAALSMRTEGQVGSNPNLSGGLGGKIYALDDEFDSYAALSIGGHLSYTVPELKGFIFTGELYYAPSVVVSGDADSVSDFNLRVTYELFENASVYGGARHFEAEYDNGGEHEFDTGPHAGIQIDF